MNILLLIFFALPIAVIIVSIALQKIFKCPFLVAAIIFAIFLVVTFIVGNLIFLVATIAYTILAFITAIITKIVCRLIRELDRRDSRNGCERERCGCSDSSQLLSISRQCHNNDNNGNLLTISSSGCNGIENELLTISSNCSRNNDDEDSSCSCNCNNNGECNCNTSNDSIAVRANVFPNNGSNGRSGSFCGCFRRR